MRYDEGINNLELDAVAQIEHNRREIVNNKQSISTLQSQVNQLLSQVPAGFLPQVYYGLTRGNQTYRFTEGYTINVSTEGNINDAYEFIANNETEDYITAIGVKINDNEVQIVIQGDYNINETEFTLINTRTGESVSVEISGALSLQDASYLGEFDAQDNREKQITVLKDLQLGTNNAIYVSIDRNGDGVYNWTRIGGYVNGKNGASIYAATNDTMSAVLSGAKVNDIILIGETFTYNDVEYAVGNLYKINTLDPLDLEQRGNIRGPQGATGATGATGQNGTDGHTPYIQDNYWYVNGVNTGIQAIGQNGSNGQDGQSFNIQSGLYSVPANYGQTGNVDAQGNPLLQLPTLPQADISGKGYVVYDPLTTPLDPYYDLYYANDSDANWTIVHPFSGIRGQNGVDGYTPYIQNGYWYINGVNTGVQATGPQGPQGPQGLSFPIGTILSYAGKTVPNGYLWCDGSTFDTTTYVTLYSVLGTNTLPNLNGRFLEGTSTANDIGTTVSAGLPNIKGSVENIWACKNWDNSPTSSGATTLGSRVTTGSGGGSGWNMYLHKLNFDASNTANNTIYGGSTTVQPNSYKVMYIIKAL